MATINIIIIAVLVIAFILLIASPLSKTNQWLATITPLASIIGSGFLVSVPLLASTIGIWAVPAIAGLTLVAFLIGGAIRYNISYGEPIFDSPETGHKIQSLEALSHLVLIAAYFISVAYYLALLAAFSLKLFGLDEPILGNILATALIASISILGATKGLKGIERAEKFTVSANLAAIAALLAALVVFALTLSEPYSFSFANDPDKAFDWEKFRLLLGMLIVVQGFETARFMGELYKGKTRVSAMRRAQIISSIIYIVFFTLMIPLYPYFTSASDVAGFIEVIGRVSPWLPFIMTGGAIASQFSASVADSIGASGLVHDTTHGKVTPTHAYVMIGAVAICIIWATDVVSIVTLASRAFALFYALQCFVAMHIAHKRNDTKNQVWFGALSALAFAMAILGIPAAG